MPLDDAMRLVGQNFDQYMQDLRERAKASSVQGSSKDVGETVSKEEKSSEISSLLSKAAGGIKYVVLAFVLNGLHKRMSFSGLFASLARMKATLILLKYCTKY